MLRLAQYTSILEQNMKVIYQGEIDRLNFITQRDGLVAAIEFAKRGIKIYREGVLRSHKRKKFRNLDYTPSHLSHMPMRSFAIVAYLQYKEFIKHNE